MQIVFPNNSFQRNTQMHSQKKLEKQKKRMLRNQEEAKACNRTATRTMRAVQLLTSAPHPHKNKRNKSIITKIPHTSENGSLQKKKKVHKSPFKLACFWHCTRDKVTRSPISNNCNAAHAIMHLQWPASSQPVAQWKESSMPLA